MDNCKVEKFGCTYNETGCSDCKVNQAYQQGRADAIEALCMAFNKDWKDAIDGGYEGLINWYARLLASAKSVY